MRYYRLHQRSADKVSEELDILKLIRRQRQHQAVMFGLLTKHQYKFSKIQESVVLSEFSTPNEDSSEVKQTDWSRKVENSTGEDQLDYVDHII